MLESTITTSFDGKSATVFIEIGPFTFIIPHARRLGLETHLDVIEMDGTKPKVINATTYKNGVQLRFVPNYLKPEIEKFVEEQLGYKKKPVYYTGV